MSGNYDYVVGVPPWGRKLPAMIEHLVRLSFNQCVLLAPFFHGLKAYSKVSDMVSRFYHPNFDDLVKFALSGSQYHGVACLYEFSRRADGLDALLEFWINKNELHDVFTMDTRESVPEKLVLYNGQKYFLPINPVWFLSYAFSGFKTVDVSKMSILGKIMPDKKSYGLVYDSQESLDKAKEHYSSMTVKKMLCCGQNFGWRHLRAV